MRRFEAPVDDRHRRAAAHLLIEAAEQREVRPISSDAPQGHEEEAIARIIAQRDKLVDMLEWRGALAAYAAGFGVSEWEAFLSQNERDLILEIKADPSFVGPAPLASSASL